MLITFSASTDSSITMFGSVARQILAIIGKDPQDASGIITAEQIPAAIDALRAAIRNEAEHVAEPTHAPLKTRDDEAPEEVISLARRCAPLLQMLGHAQHEAVPVTWKG